MNSSLNVGKLTDTIVVPRSEIKAVMGLVQDSIGESRLSKNAPKRGYSFKSATSMGRYCKNPSSKLERYEKRKIEKAKVGINQRFMQNMFPVSF